LGVAGRLPNSPLEPESSAGGRRAIRRMTGEAGISQSSAAPRADDGSTEKTCTAIG
jgi:hypothetical protein